MIPHTIGGTGAPRCAATLLALWMLAPAGASGAEAPPAAAAEADQLAGRARDLAKAGGVTEALEAWERAVAAEPGRLDHRLEYAALLKAAGWWLRSAEQYRTALDLQPDHVASLIGYGELLNAEYQFASAVGRFSRAAGIAVNPHQRERALVGLGSAQFGLEEYGAAAATFARVVAEHPRSTSAIAFLAITKRRLGDLEESIRLWSRFLELQPGASRAQFHRIEAEEMLAALHHARQLSEHEPDNAAAWARLATLLKKQPDLEGARRALDRAVRLAPGDAVLRFASGEILRDLGHWREAAEQFAAVGRDPELGSAALHNQAWCARRAGDRDGEARAWRAAWEWNAQDMHAWRRYLGALGSSSALDLERARVERHARSSPDDPVAWVRLALAEQARGDTAAARRAVLAALRADLNDVHAQTAARDLFGRDEAARRTALDALPAVSGAAPAGQASDAAGLQVRAALLLVAGSQDDAEAALRRALELGGRDPRTLVALAGCLRARGAWEEAASLLQEAAEGRADYVYARLDLALVHLDMGRAAEALATARDVVRLRPEHPLGHSLGGLALRASGDMSRAAEALRRALALDPAEEMGAPRLLLAKVLGALDRGDEAREILRGRLPEDPDVIFESAWRFVRDTYYDRTFRGQDWEAWRARFVGRLATPAEALGAVALMLASLDDRNTLLRSADQTAGLLFSQRSLATEYAPSGVALTSSRTVETKHLEGNVGYIALTNLHDPKAPEQLLKAVEEMRRSDGVILDLRGNQGGSDADVARLEGMFVQPGTETGTVVSPHGNAKTTAQQPAGAGRAPVLAADKPLVVLVDHNTGSSAESLVAGLKESGRAVVVGEKTYGKSSIQMPRLLPGGTIVLVVGAEHADLKGRIYTGTGITPDVAVPGAPAGRPEEADAALRKARQLIRKRQAGS